jgi:CreA protein
MWVLQAPAHRGRAHYAAARLRAGRVAVGSHIEGSFAMKDKWIALALLAVTLVARAEAIGEVDTVFQWIGPDHKIVVDAYDDPKVAGVTCYVSRAKTGGIKGGLGLAEDKAEASISCRQVGPIAIAKPLPKQEDMFTERISLVFKKLRVVRMVDARCNSLMCLPIPTA